MGKPAQIIKLDQSNRNFILQEEVLLEILEKVPEEMPVAVVGVVGVFRTGKSFLLNFFLRYLKNTDGTVLDTQLNVEDKNLDWMMEGGNLEGFYDESGFKWREGEKRCTTGIWLWNEHFIRKDPVTEQQMAVFLMDTQGMYDNHFGLRLTAPIFGLGSLLSNYTVFNVSMHIREDYIYQLALFSEYGRIVLNEANANGMRAFQKLEFLVRDFSHFKKGSKKKSPDALQKDMRKYLDDIMTQMFQGGLNEVREKIELCYEEIRCYCLPRPGYVVSEGEDNSAGEVKRIRPRFRRFLGDYIRRVFNDRISIKKVQGLPVTAMQLFEYVKIYCHLFQESPYFPRAISLFRATQEAIIAFATKKAIIVYNSHMTSVGAGTHFLEDIDFKNSHDNGLQLAEICFNDNFRSGDDQLNRTSLETLKLKLHERVSEFDNANRLRGKEERRAEEQLFAPAVEEAEIGPSSEWVYHTFLAHTWGTNNEIHHKVIDIARTLRAKQLKVWLDETNMRTFISADILNGLRKSASVLIFVSREYLRQAQNPNSNAWKEFYQAVAKGTEYLIPVVLDSKCLNPASWSLTKVGYHLSDLLYIDFSSESRIAANMGDLCARISEISRKPRPRHSFDTVL